MPKSALGNKTPTSQPEEETYPTNLNFDHSINNPYELRNCLHSSLATP